jgi:hypothetical protein
VRNEGLTPRIAPARPETAVFGFEAPCAPIKKRHSKPIYYGKR